VLYINGTPPGLDELPENEMTAGIASSGRPGRSIDCL